MKRCCCCGCCSETAAETLYTGCSAPAVQTDKLSPIATFDRYITWWKKKVAETFLAVRLFVPVMLPFRPPSILAREKREKTRREIKKREESQQNKSDYFSTFNVQGTRWKFWGGKQGKRHAERSKGEKRDDRTSTIIFLQINVQGSPLRPPPETSIKSHLARSPVHGSHGTGLAPVLSTTGGGGSVGGKKAQG